MPPAEKRILLAEDNAILRRAIRAALEKRGYQVAVAVDGQDALDQARADPPRLLLLDLLMPKVHGIDVLRALLSEERTRGTRVVILSNSSCDEGKDEALKLGAHAYFVKSNISPQELCQKVARWLEDPGP